MYSMELVVERGKARCPRCVAVADYSFVELGPDLLRYEVNCAGCGEAHRERLGPVPAPAGVLATTESWLPAVQVPTVPMRERALQWVGTVRHRAVALTATTTAALEALRERRRAEAVAEPAV